MSGFLVRAFEFRYVHPILEVCVDFFAERQRFMCALGFEVVASPGLQSHQWPK